jgi:flagella basal body P-ring formation protein FlgA
MRAALLAALALAACPAPAADAATQIRLRSQARCPSAVVRLGDVAEILSDDAHVAELLAEIPLRPAPAAGATQTVSRQEVRQLLLLSGVAPAALDLTGSDQVTLELAPASDSIVPRRRLVAEGVRQATLEKDFRPEGNVATADFRLAAGRRTLPASAPAQAPLPPAGAGDPPLVERGAQVSVVARTAGVRITTSGKALEAGKAGQRIQVELADSKQRVLARVVGWQAVEVAVGGDPATPLPVATATGDASRP